MAVTAWRIVKEKYIGNAFTGEGAARGGGRWNSVGSRIVYTSSSLALATLEALAHLPSYKQLEQYQCISISFDEAWIFTPDELPDGWDLVPPTTISQSFGDQWLSRGEHAVLSLSSKIIPGESNLLINPNHPDFRNMVVGGPLDYPYDSRLE
jgi:RES domain-containing protein